MTKRKTPAERKKMGRPTAFKPEYVAEAARLFAAGAIEPEVAKALGVSHATLKNWKSAHPDFLAALTSGKDIADEKVVASLYHRATGYSHPAVKIVTVARGGNQGSDVVEVPYTEHYPPDATSMIFWLKNRRPGEWRDKQEVEHSGKLSIVELLEQAHAATDAK